MLHNYSDKAVTVRVLGRMPVPTDDLKVTITKTSEPLSKDAEYVRTQKQRGILRWEVAVPAKTAPTKPKLVNYTYTLAHHKDLHISVGQPAAAAAAEMKVKFMKDLREGKR